MKTILVGGGGHALSLLETLSDYNQIAGYADMQPSSSMPIPYLGIDEEVLAKYSQEDYDIHVTLVYTSEVNLQLRKRIIERYKQYTYHTFIASTAVVTPHSVIEQGCAIMERAVVNHSKLNSNVIVNTGAIIEHGSKIGNNCFIGPGTIICGGVIIGDNTLIGAGTIIRDDITIAPNTVIGMGSVITKTIKEPGIYAGNPVRSL